MPTAWPPAAAGGVAAQGEPVDARAKVEREVEDALSALQARAAWLAALVYRDLAALKALLETLGAEEVAILANGRSTTVALGLVMEGRAWLVFRGSDDDDDWVYNLSCLPAWHIGFQLCFAGISGEVRAWVERVAPRKLPFCIVGHSLGGALATLATRLIARKKLPIELLCTFGAPRVFWPLSARWFNDMSATSPSEAPRTLAQVTYRFVDRYELVSYTPPFLALFRHVGSRIDCQDFSETMADISPLSRHEGSTAWDGLKYVVGGTMIEPWLDASRALGKAAVGIVKAGVKAGPAHNMERYAARLDHWRRHQLDRRQDELVGPSPAGRVRFTSKLIMSALTLTLVLALYIAVPALLIWGVWWLALTIPWGLIASVAVASAGLLIANYARWRSEHPRQPVMAKPSVFDRGAGKPPNSPFRQD